LKVFNYEKAVQSPDAEEWHNEIRNEKVWFNKYNVPTAIPKSSLPKGDRVLMTTWNDAKIEWDM
jgi:hypothetical protein